MKTPNLKTMQTAELVKTRKEAQETMAAEQEAGRWEEADRFHGQYIAPINDELLTRGVW